MKPGTILFEIAWEVCNQIGGIFTYLKSKIPVMLDTYGDDYLLVGPYLPDHRRADFRPIDEARNPALARTIAHLRELGFKVHYGYWLLDDSRPHVLLLDPVISATALNEVKARLWDKYQLSNLHSDQIMDRVIGFGEIVRIFLAEYCGQIEDGQDVLAHFHEWMSAACIPEVADEQVRVATVFTTHSTQLGRCLAPNETRYFTDFSEFEWQAKSVEYDIETPAQLERLIARKAHVLITDSENVAQECETFLGRKPDDVIFNGINKKPSPQYEHFELYRRSREKIDAFIQALFVPTYPVQPEKMLYFFTSGRYEYRNKGFDVTLEAIARLNGLLMQQNSDLTIVIFIISKRPFHNIRTAVLEARQKYQDLRKICAQISGRLGPRLYSNVTHSKGPALPNLNNLVDDELLLTWKQAVLNFKRKELPPVSMHQLVEEDEITRFCQMAGLDNKESNRVKVIYHPDFMERAKSLFGMDYQEFIQGCNLGIFPSLYEPWGYTPMETAIAGTPIITSDTSGFGQYISRIMPEHEAGEIHLLNRRSQSFEETAQQLTDKLFQFAESFIKDQYIPRAVFNKYATDPLCWTNLQPRYHDAYKLAFTRLYPESGLF